MDTIRTASAEEPIDYLGACARFARTIATGALSGAVAGFLAGGIGSRIAMRIVALMATAQQQGTLTDAEATVGEITAAGTAFLVVAATFVGIAGGVVYALTRMHLRPGRRWHGVAWGVLFAVACGSTLVKAANPDFERFGEPVLNIAMFAGLFVLFGAIVAPVYTLLERWLPHPSMSVSGVAALGLEAIALASAVPAVGAFVALILVQDGSVPLPQVVAAAVILYAILVVPLVRPIARSGEGGSGRIAWAALLAPLAVGVALDAQAISAIAS